MKLRKGDNVLITSGKDRGKTGKVLRAFPEGHKVLVEGVNLKKKHVRPKKSGEKGQIISMPLPIDSSKAMIVCSGCDKPVRVGYNAAGDRKFRICKKCGRET